jgi:diguanylate cyclase (GGDEF)-like protein/PAS domain S-box-containing protein
VRATAWKRYLAVLGVAYALSLLAALVGFTDLQGVILQAIGWASVIAVPIGVRYWKPSQRRPWWCFGLAGAMLLVSALVRTVHGTIIGAEYPFPSPADGIVFIGYGLLIVGLASLVRARQAAFDPEQIVDGLVVTGALGFLIWEFAVGPALSHLSGNLLAQELAAVSYLLVLVVVYLTTRLAVGPGARTPSFFLIMMATTAIFLTDLSVTIETARGTAKGVFLVIAPLAYIFAGGAAVHPTMVRITERPAVDDGPLSLGRLLILAGGLAVAPIVILTDIVHHRPPDGLTLALSCLMSVLVLVRLTLMVRNRERRNRQERLLREAGARLAGASPEILNDVVLDALRKLTTNSSAARVEVLYGDASPPSAGRTRAVVPVGDPRDPRGWLTAECLDGLEPETEEYMSTLARMVELALSGRELTERMERERIERRFRSIIEQSSDLIAVIDPDAGMQFATPPIERMIGVPLGVTAGEVLDLVHPDDRRAARRLWADTMSWGGSGRPSQMRMKDRTGAYQWFEVTARDLRLDPEVCGVVLYARLVTDRKRAEDRVARNEARFRALVQHSSDLVAVVDDQGAFGFVSPAATKLLGYEPAALVGMGLFELLATDDLEASADLAAVLGSRFDRHRTELAVVTQGGARHVLDVTLSDLRDDPAVGGIVVNATDITDRKALEHVLRHQALHDDLTGLGNRATFALEVAAAAERSSLLGSAGMAVLVIDLDDFKTVNDSLGHAVGDELLVIVAHRLRGVLRGGDIATRLGGDEFVLLIAGHHSEAEVGAVAERILGAVREPALVHGHTIHITASIGVALSDGTNLSSEELLRNADLAMYLAKERGKDRFELFEEQMHATVAERLELKADLSRAVEHDELVVHYQPVVSLTHGTVLGAEALVRWQHPRRGLLGPGSFISLAEETGLIVPLGRAVLDAACRQLVRWLGEREGLGSFRLSVNASVREIEERDFVEEVLATCTRHGLPTSRLVLEVTESTLMRDVELVRERLTALSRAGVALSVDDFGTGYSSLGSLRQYPFDLLKIDRTFVAGLGTRHGDEMLRTIVQLGASLGVQTVAEGVERPEEVNRLRGLGCNAAQGFLFAPPMPAEQFEQWIDAPLVAV